MTKLSLETIKSNIDRSSFVNIENFDQLMGIKQSQLFVNYPSSKKEQFDNFDLMSKPNTLYVHIPFCTGICTYCAYVTSRATLGDAKIDNYLDLLEKEFILYHNKLGRIKIATAYIGGGTPTIMDLPQLDRLYKLIHKHFDISDIEEYTLEGCPETMVTDKVKQGMDNGINRISMGVESFNDNILTRMNRRHSNKQSIKAIEQAKKLGISVDIDIIRCYPGYNEQMVLDDVNTINNVRPNSITTYKYNLKPSSIDNKKIIPFLTNNETIEHTLLYYEGLKLGGYSQHNIDWFVADKKDTFKHQIYKWEYDANQIALGVGVYGYIGNTQYFNHKSAVEYKNKINSNMLPISHGQTLDERELEDKNIMFALRDRVILNNFPKHKQKLDELVSNGLAHINNGYLELNQIGKLYIDQIQSYFATNKQLCTLAN